MDGYISYTNIKFVEFCWKYKIISIYLPPYLTYFSQPLDFVIFCITFGDIYCYYNSIGVTSWYILFSSILIVQVEFSGFPKLA